MKKRSGARRVIVRSLSNPPRSFSIAVYTMRCKGTSMSLAHRRCRTCNASRPVKHEFAERGLIEHDDVFARGALLVENVAAASPGCRASAAVVGAPAGRK